MTKFALGSAHRMRGNQELILLRGFPGAGKSTFGATLSRSGFFYYEADQWRGEGDERVYDPELNCVAHGWCLGQAAEKLRLGHDVAVGNVFAELHKMLPYFKLAKDLKLRGHNIKVTVLHVHGPIGRSVHEGVDYQMYMDQWQDYTGEYRID